MDNVLAISSSSGAVDRRDNSDLTIQELIAPFFLGIIVNYFLWGVQITQSYYYYKSYRRTDRTWLKAAVGLLFITDVIESICVSAAGWRFMVDGWGDLNDISLFPGWGLYAIPLTDSFTASIVHFFYAQKIWTLLDAPLNYVCTAIVISLSCLQLAGGVGGSAFMYSVTLSFAEFGRIKTWGCIWLVTASATDIVITVIMTLKLSKSRTGFKRTDDIISKLIRLTVETGFATAVVQIVEIILYLCWPQKPYHIVLGCMTPKVYSNSMLALLNSRQVRKTDGEGRDTLDLQDRAAHGIYVHTTQTAATDYGLDTKVKTADRNSHLRTDKSAVPEAASINSQTSFKEDD